MENQNKIVCPTCNKKDTWKTENAFRPFCSERCKLIDLGAWADETHCVPGEKINPEPGEGASEDGTPEKHGEKHA